MLGLPKLNNKTLPFSTGIRCIALDSGQKGDCFQRGYTVVHWIPLCYTGIWCMPSNSRWKAFALNGNSMQCIEFPYMQYIEIQMKDNWFQRDSDTLHRIPFDSNCLSSGFRCSASNLHILYLTNLTNLHWEHKSIFRESLRNLKNLLKLNTCGVYFPCSSSLGS